MPNSINFGEPIPVPYINVRPERLTNIDENLIDSGIKQVLFGTDSNDVVEIWIYDSNGASAGHTIIPCTSDILSLTTVIDNTGAYEMLNLDMGKIIRLLNLENGRYGFVANFFRNEVGSEFENHFFIEDINSDRTELRLFPKSISADMTREIFDWVDPSVPKLDAQALISQLFGKNELASESNSLDIEKIEQNFDSDIPVRIQYSGAQSQFENLLSQIVSGSYTLAINKLANDTTTKNIHEINLMQYITEALSETIFQLKLSGKLDPRLEIF